MLTTYETISLNAEVRDGDAQRALLHAAYRAGASLSLTIEVLDAEYVAAHQDDVQREIAQFVAEACARAAAAGVPVGGVVAAS